jgi:DNA primase
VHRRLAAPDLQRSSFSVPQLAPELIDQINAANDIVEVIGGYFPLKRAGAMWKALCPFHQERTPSFTVNPQRQIFKCFGCGAGGGPIRFVMMYENLGFVDAAKKLAERAGIRVEEGMMSAEEEARVSMRRRLLALHSEAADFFHFQLMKRPSAQIARDYLKSRGMGSEVAKSWKIGYAPDAWDAMAAFARDHGFNREELVQTGLVKLRDEDRSQGDYYDRFRGRVMIPICNDTGEVIAFSGRVLEKDAKAAKYINSPETMLFTKGSVLFGLHKSKRALIDKGSAIVCEGQLDLITAFEAGVQNVVAAQGTAFTDRQARKLKQYVEEVVLCFDSDAAGEKAAERSLGALLAANLTIRVATMPAGDDPDSLIRGQGADAFRDRISAAKDFFDFLIDRETGHPEFASPRGRVAAARKLAGATSLITDPVLRGTVMNRAAMRLEISPEEFARRLTAVRAESAGQPEVSDAVAPPLKLEPTIRLLCAVALRDEASRTWLLEEHWTEMLEQEPDSELLAKILMADLQPENPHSIQALLATLTASEEAAITGLLEDRPPQNPLHIAHDAWRELERRRIQRRLDSCKARLRQPGLLDEEVVKLQKEVLDLAGHLANVARLFSPPL